MIIPIEGIHGAYLDLLASLQGARRRARRGEHSSRIRGTFGWRCRTSSGWAARAHLRQQSEMATGYATLYGDHGGGFAVIKDVPKSSCKSSAAPQFRRRPRPHPGGCDRETAFAELRPDQLDTDSLPPINLDPILEATSRKPQPRRDRCDGLRRGHRATVMRCRPQRIQSAASRRRREDHAPQLWPRPALPITNRYRPGEHAA